MAAVVVVVVVVVVVLVLVLVATLSFWWRNLLGVMVWPGAVFYNVFAKTTGSFWWSFFGWFFAASSPFFIFSWGSPWNALLGDFCSHELKSVTSGYLSDDELPQHSFIALVMQYTASKITTKLKTFGSGVGCPIKPPVPVRAAELVQLRVSSKIIWVFSGRHMSHEKKNNSYFRDPCNGLL